MASFLCKRAVRGTPPAVACIGASLAAAFALCGSASAESVTGPLASTVSQVSSSVAPTAHTVTQIATDTVTAATTQPSTTPVQSTPEQPAQPSTTGVLDRVVDEVAKPAPVIHATSSVTRALTAGGEYARQVVSHTLTHGAGGLERALTQTASSTLAKASSSVEEVARHAPHVLGSTLADRTSQIIPQPAEDAAEHLLLNPAGGTQPPSSFPVSETVPAPGMHVTAQADVSSFGLAAHGQAALASKAASSSGLPVSGRPAIRPAASRPGHDGALPSRTPSSPAPAPGGYGSGALAGSAGSGGLLLFTLLGLLALAGSWATRRLRILGDPLRPAPFVLIPQRPG